MKRDAVQFTLTMIACAILVLVAGVLVPGCALEGSAALSVPGPSAGAAGSAPTGPTASAEVVSSEHGLTFSCPFTMTNIVRYGLWLIGEPDAQMSECHPITNSYGTTYFCYHSYSTPQHAANEDYGRIQFPRQVASGCSRHAYAEYCEAGVSRGSTACYLIQPYTCGGATNDTFRECQ